MREKFKNIEKDVDEINGEMEQGACKRNLRKLAKRLNEVGNEESDLHKKIKGVKDIWDNCKKVLKYYEDYASWIPGLPDVPKFLLKED